MKVVVALDSFKGCMGSRDAGEIVARGLADAALAAEVTVIATADGGEGTTDAVIAATGGELRSATVMGPFGDPVTARFGVVPDGRTVVLEMASASGVELVPPDRLDPLAATSFGTGELMVAALDAGARDLIVGVGGSATVDGGVGMAQALGWGVLRADGTDCSLGGGALGTVDRIDGLGVRPELAFSRVRVACDVSNPLLGERGAARVFGPQKGASPDAVEQLERGLEHLAEVWRREGLLDAVDRPGDGAAGGLGAGLRAFCRAELCAGAELIAEITGLDRMIRAADVLITGEGRTDAQTAGGKLPAVLAAKARRAGVTSVLVSGAIAGDLPELDELFDVRFATVGAEVRSDEAIRNGRANLAATAREVGRALASGTVATAARRDGRRRI
jgi:glycerate kinase